MLTGEWGPLERRDTAPEVGIGRDARGDENQG
jgi:hypothetical protein